MTCHNCRIDTVKAGFYGKTNRVQRWKCQQCGKRFADAQEKPFGADVRLPKETVIRILHCLVEGTSVRDSIKDKVDTFLNAWLTANPKAR